MAKVTTLLETKDFIMLNIEQLVGSVMTNELNLGTHDDGTIRPKALDLKSEEPKESETDDEEAGIMTRFKKLFNKNYKGNNVKKPTKLSCNKYGGLDHFIKEFPLWENEKTKGKFKEK